MDASGLRAVERELDVDPGVAELRQDRRRQLVVVEPVHGDDDRPLGRLDDVDESAVDVVYRGVERPAVDRLIRREGDGGELVEDREVVERMSLRRHDPSVFTNASPGEPVSVHTPDPSMAMNQSPVTSVVAGLIEDPSAEHVPRYPLGGESPCSLPTNRNPLTPVLYFDRSTSMSYSVIETSLMLAVVGFPLPSRTISPDGLRLQTPSIVVPSEATWMTVTPSGDSPSTV